MATLSNGKTVKNGQLNRSSNNAMERKWSLVLEPTMGVKISQNKKCLFLKLFPP